MRILKKLGNLRLSKLQRIKSNILSEIWKVSSGSRIFLKKILWSILYEFQVYGIKASKSYDIRKLKYLYMCGIIQMILIKQ